MELEGHVAIITGASRGIGKAIAIALGNEGASVVVAARSKKELENVAQEIYQAGSKSKAVVTDVRKNIELKNLYKKTIQEFGRVDILINNAGIGMRKPFTEVSESDWDNMIQTNLNSVYTLTNLVLPKMIEQNKGVIINISSGAGKQGFPLLSAYCATKFAVNGLTQSIAKEVNNCHVRVYSVSPGGVNTDMHRNSFPEHDLTKLLKPEEVANKVLKLCTPSCSTKSGSIVDIHKGVF